MSFNRVQLLWFYLQHKKVFLWQFYNLSLHVMCKIIVRLEFKSSQ